MDYYSKDDKTVRSVTLFENQLMIIRPGVFHFQKVPNKVHMMVLEFLYDRDGVLITDFLINNNFINSINLVKNSFITLFFINSFGFTIFYLYICNKKFYYDKST